MAVRLAQDQDQARLEISNAGIGIPAEVLPRLFSRFYRAPNASELHISGTGIGLYVVRGIVTRHGGTVEVASVEREGSTFTVRLPLASLMESLTFLPPSPFKGEGGILFWQPNQAASCLIGGLPNSCPSLQGEEVRGWGIVSRCSMNEKPLHLRCEGVEGNNQTLL